MWIHNIIWWHISWIYGHTPVYSQKKNTKCIHAYKTSLYYFWACMQSTLTSHFSVLHPNRLFFQRKRKREREKNEPLIFHAQERIKKYNVRNNSPHKYRVINKILGNNGSPAMRYDGIMMLAVRRSRQEKYPCGWWWAWLKARKNVKKRGPWKLPKQLFGSIMIIMMNVYIGCTYTTYHFHGAHIYHLHIFIFICYMYSVHMYFCILQVFSVCGLIIKNKNCAYTF